MTETDPTHPPVPHLFMVMTIGLLGLMAVVSMFAPTGAEDAATGAAATGRAASGGVVWAYVPLAVTTLGTAIWLTAPRLAAPRRSRAARMGDQRPQRDRVSS